MKRLMDWVFIFLLMFISLTVAIAMTCGVTMWEWIVAYWVTLSIKNLFDYGWKLISRSRDE